MRSKPTVLIIFLLGILVSSLVFSPLILDFTLSTRLISISLVLLLCFLFLLRSKEILIFKYDIITLSYLSFVVFSCVSTFWANTASESYFENARLVISFLIFLLSCHFLKKDKDVFINSLCKLSVLIVMIELILVVYQLSKLQIVNKEALYTIYGLNSHKNLLSSFLYINLFFLIISITRFEKFRKYLSIASVIINLAIIGLIQTKAVWIALAVSLLLLFTLWFYKKIKLNLNFKISLIAMLILANVFFMIIQPKIIKRGLDYNSSLLSKDAANKKELDNERLQLWDKTYDMISKHPVTGVGAGNWQIYFPDATLKGMYRAEDLNFTFQRPHNDLLWIIAETGFIGFNLFLVFILSLLIFLLPVVKKINEKEITVEAILCVITIIGFFTASFFDFPKERIEHLIWINIIFALAYHLISEHTTIKVLKEKSLGKTSFLLLTIISITATTISVYRYRGEYYTKRMFDQKGQSNNMAVVKEGQKALSFAYTIDPMSLPIKWYTGNAYAVLGNYNAARKDLLEALELNPFNRNVLNDVASAYVTTNEVELAKKYYLEASRISPRFDDPKLNLSVLYIKEKQFQKADTCLRSILHDSERRTNYQKMVDSFLGK